MKNLTLVIISALIGMTGFTSAPPVAALILAVPVLWTFADSRRAAFAVMFAYNLAVSRELFSGAALFLPENHSPIKAACLWFLAASAVSLPFGLFGSSNNSSKKAVCLVLALGVTYILPLFSLIGIANPLMASGCLFPGLGFAGLAAVTLIYAFCAMDRRIGTAFLCVIALLPFMPFSHAKAQSPAGITAVNTSFGRAGSGSFNFVQNYERTSLVFDELKKSPIRECGSPIFVLPETVAGRLNKTGLLLWRDEIQKLLPGKTVLFGAELPSDDGRKYDNAVIMLHDGQMSAVYQRISVPYAMYRGPFSEIGANLHLFDDGIFSLPLPDGRKAAVLICYEAFLTWPLLNSMRNNPDVIICLANLWWCRETSLPFSMERAVSLWALTFGVPAVLARNI